MTIVRHTPELLYAETTARTSAYRALARRYADAGDAVGAVAATWAADIGTVQAVMWERVMIASPDPDQQLADITEAVARALAAYTVAAPSATTAVEAVQAARAGLAEAFDPFARALVERRLPTLAHLDGLPAPTAAEMARITEERLGDATVAELVAERADEARTCLADAVELDRAGRTQDALALAWQADWATLEAYLLDTARVAGDQTLVSVELRWALAVRATDAIASLPADLGQAVATIRHCLVESLGTVEGERLRRRFEPLPA